MRDSDIEGGWCERAILRVVGVNDPRVRDCEFERELQQNTNGGCQSHCVQRKGNVSTGSGVRTATTVSAESLGPVRKLPSRSSRLTELKSTRFPTRNVGVTANTQSANDNNNSSTYTGTSKQ